MSSTLRLIILASLACASAFTHAAELPASAVQQTTAPADSGISVGLGTQPPSGFYTFDGTTLSWRDEPETPGVYLFAVIQSTATKELLSGCKVTALLKDAKGKPIGTTITLEETWDPTFRHYGANIDLPRETSTTGSVDLAIEPFTGRRRGFNQGNFFTSKVFVSFPDVNFSTSDATTTSTTEADATSETRRVEWPEGRRPYIEPTPYPGSNNTL